MSSASCGEPRCTLAENCPATVVAPAGRRPLASPSLASRCGACARDAHSAPDVPPRSAPAQSPASSTTPPTATSQRSPSRRTRSVVRAYRRRQSILPKPRFENRSHPLRVCLLHRLAAQQVTAVGIRDSQRIDTLAIAAAKPPLEIGAPHPVTTIGMPQRLGVGRRFASLLACHYQPSSLDLSRQSCWPPARLRPTRRALTLASTSVAPTACAPAAAPAPPARWPLSVSLRCRFAAPFNSSSPASPCTRYRRSHTYPVSLQCRNCSHSRSCSAHPAHTPAQTAPSLPSHCSLPSCHFLHTSWISSHSGMLPVCSSIILPSVPGSTPLPSPLVFSVTCEGFSVQIRANKGFRGT